MRNENWDNNIIIRTYIMINRNWDNKRWKSRQVKQNRKWWETKTRRDEMGNWEKRNL